MRNVPTRASWSPPLPPSAPPCLQVDQVAAALFGVTYIVVVVLIFTLQNGCEWSCWRRPADLLPDVLPAALRTAT